MTGATLRGVLWLATGLVVPLPLPGCDTPVEPPQVRVVRVVPHDTTAFTQGLLHHEGLLYESTGLHGESTLREVEPETGEVLRRVELDREYFAEGVARVGSTLIQVTWRQERAFVYDLETLEVVRTFAYEGEAWGLCHDGASLFQSRGDSVLIRRDPGTFQALDTLRVTRRDGGVGQLNELECVGGDIYANVLPTGRILRIDSSSGRVVDAFDLSDLTADRGGDYSGAMNGIAHDPASSTFYLTGKRWPSMFEVRLPDD